MTQLNHALGDGAVRWPGAPAGASATPAPPVVVVPKSQVKKRGLSASRSPNRAAGDDAPAAAASAARHPDDARDGAENRPPDSPDPRSAAELTAEIHTLKKQKHAAQTAKSKVKKSRDGHKGQAAWLAEQYEAMSAEVQQVRAEMEAVRAQNHELKRRAQQAGGAEAKMSSEKEDEEGRLVERLQAELARVHTELAAEAQKEAGYRTSLEGVRLQIRELGFNSHHWAGTPTRMACAKLHAVGSVPLEKCLPNLLIGLRAFGTDVKCDVSDSTEVTIGGITESFGMIRWQLAEDAARVHNPSFVVPPKAPKPALGAAMEADPTAESGPLKSNPDLAWYRREVIAAVEKWRKESAQAENELIEMVEKGRVLTAKEYLDKHCGGNWTKVRFRGCGGLCLMIDDTSCPSSTAATCRRFSSAVPASPKPEKCGCCTWPSCLVRVGTRETS